MRFREQSSFLDSVRSSHLILWCLKTWFIFKTIKKKKKFAYQSHRLLHGVWIKAENMMNYFYIIQSNRMIVFCSGWKSCWESRKTPITSYLAQINKEFASNNVRFIEFFFAFLTYYFFYSSRANGKTDKKWSEWIAYLANNTCIIRSVLTNEKGCCCCCFSFTVERVSFENDLKWQTSIYSDIDTKQNKQLPTNVRYKMVMVWKNKKDVNDQSIDTWIRFGWRRKSCALQLYRLCIWANAHAENETLYATLLTNKCYMYMYI